LHKKIGSQVTKIGAGLLAGILAPSAAHGCACGCGIFDVGSLSMIPGEMARMAFLQYAYQDQDRNWNGTGQAPAANNGDKEIATSFLTLAFQYMFNSQWGAQVEVPYDFRYFRGTDEAGHIGAHRWSQVGDLRLEGIYAGFSADQSSGLLFGLKLPTGSHSEDPNLVDRDTQIGTGSTDLLLGGFHQGGLPVDYLGWFAQALLNVPTLTQNQYRPGIELDSAVGIDYTGLTVGSVQISPLGQVFFSARSSDSGANADPADSGYERILLSPGLEVRFRSVTIYGDVEFPVFQNFTGNQLAAPVLFKVSVSYMF
jgi:hypothetical protein